MRSRRNPPPFFETREEEELFWFRQEIGTPGDRATLAVIVIAWAMAAFAFLFIVGHLEKKKPVDKTEYECYGTIPIRRCTKK